MAPFFSIGITTYDREEMLVDTLKSILAQTFDDYEAIVSNDNPEKRISAQSTGIRDSRFRFVNQTINLGTLSNTHYLLRESNGRYFTLIADDDLYLPDFLETVYKTLVKYSFPKCVFTSYDVFQKEPPFIKKDKAVDEGMLFDGPDFFYNYSKGKTKTITTMGVFERKTLQDIGGLEDLSSNGTALFSEYLLLARTIMMSKIGYINRPLILFRSHEGSWGYANTDLDAYRRGADNLTRRSIGIFKDRRLRKYFYAYLYYILKLVILNNLAIMSRRKKFGDKSFKRIMAYLICAGRYIDTLKGSGLYLVGLAALIHAEISTGLFLLGCNIRKKTCKDFKKYGVA